MAKYLPHGTTVTINGQQIGGLTTVSIPDQTRGSAETTDSGSNFWREFIPGLRDPGTVNLTFRHKPEDPGQQELSDNYNLDTSNNVVTIVITLPPSAGGSNDTYTFDGFVTAAPSGDLALADDTAAELSATIQVSGAVSIT